MPSTDIDLTPTPPPKPQKPDAAGMRTVNALPMPPGQVVRNSPDQPQITPQELTMLRQQGYQEGDPLPDYVRTAQELARQRNAEFVPPVPMDTPPSVIETVDITQLSPEKQAEVRRVLQQAQQPQRTPPAAQPPDISGILRRQPPPPVPQPAPAPTPAPVPQRSQFNQPTRPVAEIDLDVPPADERPAATPEPAPPAPAPPAPAPPAVEQGIAGGDFLKDCPHCQLRLDQPSIPEPGPVEKQAFLQSVIGQKPFIKDYELFGGAVRVRLRTLTTPELDEIYKQVLLEQEQRVIRTETDFYERINRYRLFLQLLQVETRGPGGYLRDLPDGYTVETNPHAGGFWKFKREDVRQTGLPLIERWLLDNVLVTETLMRSVNMTCGRFNRLVAKMEALVNTPDFWSGTGRPS
jgi:hypothetical protein